MSPVDKDAQGKNESSRNTIKLLSRYEPTAGFSIDIPSAHVMGWEKDLDIKDTEVLLQSCEEGLVKVVSHGSGHTVPRSQVANGGMVDTIIWVIEKSRFQFFGYIRMFLL